MSRTDPLAEVEHSLREHFGHPPIRASVSFLGVESIEILRFEPIPGEWAYLTIGMSRHPMTPAADAVQAVQGARAELMLHVRATGDATVGAAAEVWRRLAVLGAAPAVEGVVYTAGMTVDLGEPLGAGSRCTGVLIAESAVADVMTTDGPVQILQATPATSTELAWSRIHGSAALRERWLRQSLDLLNLGRRPADLST